MNNFSSSLHEHYDLWQACKSSWVSISHLWNEETRLDDFREFSQLQKIPTSKIKFLSYVHLICHCQNKAHQICLIKQLKSKQEAFYFLLEWVPVLLLLFPFCWWHEAIFEYKHIVPQAQALLKYQIFVICQVSFPQHKLRHNTHAFLLW